MPMRAPLAGIGGGVTGDDCGAPEVRSQVAGAALCVLLRFVAIRRGWRLPMPRHSDTPAGSTDVGMLRQGRSSNLSIAPKRRTKGPCRCISSTRSGGA